MGQSICFPMLNCDLRIRADRPGLLLDPAQVGCLSEWKGPGFLRRWEECQLPAEGYIHSGRGNCRQEASMMDVGGEPTSSSEKQLETSDSDKISLPTVPVSKTIVPAACVSSFSLSPLVLEEAVAAIEGIGGERSLGWEQRSRPWSLPHCSL